MYRLSLILGIILVGLQAWAQTRLDSLYAVWEDTTRPDTTRAIALEDLIYEGYFYAKPDSAAILADELYQFTQAIDYKIGIVNALNLAGYNYFRMGNYNQALDAYQEGLAIAENINDKKGIADLCLKTGFLYHDNEDIIRALQYYERSRKIYEEIDDKEGLGSIYNEYGSIYLSKAEYEKALDYYFKSIAINDEIGDEDRNAAMYSNIGSLYLDQENFGEALGYFQKALAIYEHAEDKLGIASGLAGIGNVYGDQGRYKEALKQLHKSLRISEEIEDAQGAASTLQNIGNIYLDQEEYVKAIAHCKKSLALAIDLGDIGNQESACYCLYTAYKASGNTTEALAQLEQQQVLSDSLKSEETAKNLQELEFSKQVLADSLLHVEKDLQVEMAHQAEVRQKDKNRNLAVGAGIFFLLLSGAFFSRWRYVKKSKAILEKEKERSESLLLNILPAAIAEELKANGEAAARDFDLVSILFSDFKGYTEKSEKLSAKELVGEINHCFKAFDYICEEHGIEKIKTIGDAYMAAGGLPVPADEAVANTVLAALEMQAFISDRAVAKKEKNEIAFEMRLGIHTGPVVAGIVGVKKFQYDIWGDTVNISSRMESNGEIGKVNISHDTYELIKDDPQFIFASRGKIEVKGKGKMDMWFVEKSPLL